MLGIAVAWWLNPLSLGSLGYVLSNVRAWRFWTIMGLFVWATVNLMVSLSIVSRPARINIINGLLLVGYILLGLLFLYIQLRVFIWAASGKPFRFFFGNHGLGGIQRSDLLGDHQPRSIEYHSRHDGIRAAYTLRHLLRRNPVRGNLLVHGPIARGSHPSGRPEAGYLR